MRKSRVATAAVLLTALLLWVGPVSANVLWSTFGDPDVYFAGSTYPVRWIGDDRTLPNGIWKWGYTQGDVAIVNGQVRLSGNGTAGISGGIIRYDDVYDVIYGTNNDVSFEFTVVDFQAMRAMPDALYPGLQIGVWTGSYSMFGIRRDVGGETWRFVAYDNYHPAETTATGELVPLDATRISIKFIRTGNIVTLDAAYDADATTETPEGFLQEGNFHHALDNYLLTPGQRSYMSLRVVWLPSLPQNANDPQNAVFIDDVVVSGPFVPKIKETPGVVPANFGGPDWPPLTISTDTPSGGSWYEAGDRFEMGVNALKGVYPPEYQWLRAETSDGPAVEIPGATGPHFVIDPLTLDDSGWYSCRITNSQAKTQLFTERVPVQVFPADSLPSMGVVGLCIVAMVCVLMAMVCLRGRRSARESR